MMSEVRRRTTGRQAGLDPQSGLAGADGLEPYARRSRRDGGTAAALDALPSTRFSLVGPLVASTSSVYTAETARSVVGCQVTVDTADPSNAVGLALLVNGSSVATFTLPTGETKVYADSFDPIALAVDVDDLQVEITDPGSGTASKLTVRVDWQ